jgi:hypothetical protein
MSGDSRFPSLPDHQTNSNIVVHAPQAVPYLSAAERAKAAAEEAAAEVAAAACGMSAG